MPATYENDLVLATVFLKHDDLARSANVTFAFVDGTLNISAAVWAQAIQDGFVNRWESRIDENVAMTKTTTIKGDGTEIYEVGESTSAPAQGLLNISALQPNTACLIKKLTAVGGRQNRGRFYLPWVLPDADVDEIGGIAGARVAGLQATADDFLTDFDQPASSSYMCIANREYDLPWDNPNRTLIAVTAGPQVTALVVESICATQRRRMPRQ